MPISANQMASSFPQLHVSESEYNTIGINEISKSKAISLTDRGGL
jgi:hypothetical protein